MANRSDEVILAQYDAPPIVGIGLITTDTNYASYTVRPRLQLEVLLDCRQYLKQIKKTLEDILAKP